MCFVIDLAHHSRLQNDPEPRNIPIVAITSHNYAFHDEALAAGCTKVVDKSLTLEEMEKHAG